MPERFRPPALLIQALRDSLHRTILRGDDVLSQRARKVWDAGESGRIEIIAKTKSGRENLVFFALDRDTGKFMFALNRYIAQDIPSEEDAITSHKFPLDAIERESVAPLMVAEAYLKGRYSGRLRDVYATAIEASELHLDPGRFATLTPEDMEDRFRFYMGKEQALADCGIADYRRAAAAIQERLRPRWEAQQSQFAEDPLLKETWGRLAVIVSDESEASKKVEEFFIRLREGDTRMVSDSHPIDVSARRDPQEYRRFLERKGYATQLDSLRFLETPVPISLEEAAAAREKFHAEDVPSYINEIGKEMQSQRALETLGLSSVSELRVGNFRRYEKLKQELYESLSPDERAVHVAEQLVLLSLPAGVESYLVEGSSLSAN